MKNFYIILFALPVLLFTLLYLSVWWFLGAVGLVLIFTVYRFYAVRMETMQTKNETLEHQLNELQVQLDYIIIKEQKVSKEAENVRKLKQQLLAAMSHEIRTPMNGVMGMSLLLSDTPLNSEQQEYVMTIRNCGESLLTTVNDILANDALDFSKLDREEKLEYKEFELRDCVEETLDIFAKKVAKSGIDLLYEIDDNVPAQIIGDNKRVRQILMNLVENAVKFTARGEIFVGIHFGNNATGNNPEVSFEVHDTGIGISKDQLKQLFKGIPGKDFQKDSEQTRGLGLVICRKLAELMGGSIEAKTELGKGSTFTFKIPVVPSLKEIRNHVQFDNMVQLEGKMILIVDDNPLSLSIMIKQLKKWKILPVGVDSGIRALDILSQNNNFDLVITDLNMPVMNGIQLGKEIKNKNVGTKILLMSPAGDDSHEQTPEIFTSILQKPLRQISLRDKLLDIFIQDARNQNTENGMKDVFARQFPLRILIAEDNIINQKIAMKILTRLGYEPVIANNGKEVMEMVALEHYDIILMDVQMPVMDGLEATRMIRTCLEIQPVIMAMTANVLQGDRDDCMQAGMDDYISKPIDLKELLSHLEKWSVEIKHRRKVSA